MNLTCPECSTLYRIDPARVPAEGVAARCKECGTAFRVEADGAHVPGEVRQAARLEPAAPAAAPPEPTPEPTPDPAPPPAPEPTAAEPPPAEPAVEPSAPSPSPELEAPPEAPTEPAPAPSAPAFGPQDPDTRARRLARALVSDIKVYNPEKWGQSREDGTLRKAFRDEILKSWEEYVEQVGEEMAKKTPYFRNALNEILAGGERVF